MTSADSHVQQQSVVDAVADLEGSKGLAPSQTDDRLEKLWELPSSWLSVLPLSMIKFVARIYHHERIMFITLFCRNSSLQRIRLSRAQPGMSDWMEEKFAHPWYRRSHRKALRLTLCRGWWFCCQFTLLSTTNPAVYDSSQYCRRPNESGRGITVSPGTMNQFGRNLANEWRVRKHQPPRGFRRNHRSGFTRRYRKVCAASF